MTLRALLKSPLIKVVGVVTQPDRPAGRHRMLTPCPCRAYALERGLSPIITPEKINAPEILDQIRALKPDLIAVVAFGQFLGQTLLSLPPHGCINGHFSLLPRYRGAAPVQAAIASGDKITGVTVMQMDKGMDTGDILLTAIEPICSDDSAGDLLDRLAILGGVTMVKAIRLMLQGQLKRVPQNNALATYARKFTKHDGLISWARPAAEIERTIRAYDPWPSCFTFLPPSYIKAGQTGRVKVLEAQILREEINAPEYTVPGTVCLISPIGPIVRTGGGGCLCLTALQPEGSKRMDGKAFLNGRPLKPGDVLGTCPPLPGLPC